MSILVSVPVVTYNAAEFVLETLESIFNQTYQNIELIVSDDCSKDNTVEIVKKWCEQDSVKQRFVDVKIITVPKNTGVSANCNRAIAASNGKWIKFIAGDDILWTNCIEDNMNFVATNPEASIIFSQVNVYQDTFEQKNYTKTIPSIYPDNLMHKNFSALDQFKILLESDRVNYTPSYFFNKQTILSIGGYDEGNKLVEDYPMWLKLTKAGIRLCYFHKPTVGYRIHSKATNNTGEGLLFKPSVINSHLVRKTFAHPYLPWGQVMKENWVHKVTLFFKWIGIVKKSSVNSALYKLATIYCNPFYYLDYMKKNIKSMSNIHVSIIIPMYKVADYVTRCIESLENQDIDKSHYEIICINDGSPDNCKEVVEELQKKYTNIILLSQENQGVSMARNNGIAISKGKYILPIDPDDYVVQNSFGRIISLTQKLDCDVLYLGFEIFDVNHKSIWKTNYSKQNHIFFNGVEGYFQARGYEVKDPDRSWAILYKKELLDKYQINYPKNVPYLEDGLFLAKVFAVANTVSFDNQIFYQRTSRPGSATHSKLFGTEKAINGFIFSVNDITEFRKRNKLSIEQNDLINHVIAKFVLLAVSPSVFSFNFKKYRETLKVLKENNLHYLNTKGISLDYKSRVKIYNFSKFLFLIFFRFQKKYTQLFSFKK